MTHAVVFAPMSGGTGLCKLMRSVRESCLWSIGWSRAFGLERLVWALGNLGRSGPLPIWVDPQVGPGPVGGSIWPRCASACDCGDRSVGDPTAANLARHPRRAT